jgi:hypothetical protein
MASTATMRLGAWLQSPGVEGAGEWQMYDRKKDPSERHDLTKLESERLAEMLGKYAEYSEDVKVIDVGPDFNPVSVIADGQSPSLLRSKTDEYQAPFQNVSDC